MVYIFCTNLVTYTAGIHARFAGADHVVDDTAWSSRAVFQATVSVGPDRDGHLLKH